MKDTNNNAITRREGASLLVRLTVPPLFETSVSKFAPEVLPSASFFNKCFDNSFSLSSKITKTT